MLMLAVPGLGAKVVEGVVVAEDVVVGEAAADDVAGGLAPQDASTTAMTSINAEANDSNNKFVLFIQFIPFEFDVHQITLYLFKKQLHINISLFYWI